MNLLVFQEDKVYIQQCLENGGIDYLEVASEGAETQFFEYINSRGILDQLSQTYPQRFRSGSFSHDSMAISEREEYFLPLFIRSYDF